MIPIFSSILGGGGGGGILGPILGGGGGGSAVGGLIPDFGGMIQNTIKQIMAPIIPLAKSASSGMIASSVCLSCLIFGFLMVQIILKFV